MIQTAKREDIPALAALLSQVQALHAEGKPEYFKKGGRKYSDEELEAILLDDKNAPIYIWKDQDGKIQAYAFCRIETREETATTRREKTLYIDDLCVNRELRGSGIGSELYKYVKAMARQQHCDSVTLNVWDFPGSAFPFYQKMGMKVRKTLMEDWL